MFSPGQLAQWACVIEVSAPKAGNVHPGAPFGKIGWQEFIVSAMVIRPILDRAPTQALGTTIYECAEATHEAVRSNTNLGIVLLLAPLCAAEREEDLSAGVKRVLAHTTPDDATMVYRAIRLASPGGLGTADRGDVRRNPEVSLVEAMRLASDRDAVARQYVNGFRDVLQGAGRFNTGGELDRQIVAAHLHQMADEPDSLIQRKCGSAVALESQQRARAVLEAGGPNRPEARQFFNQLDQWLRADGNRRNPGTSADLVTAALYVAMRHGRICPPFAWTDEGLRHGSDDVSTHAAARGPSPSSA